MSAVPGWPEKGGVGKRVVEYSGVRKMSKREREGKRDSQGRSELA